MHYVYSRSETYAMGGVAKSEGCALASQMAVAATTKRGYPVFTCWLCFCLPLSIRVSHALE